MAVAIAKGTDRLEAMNGGGPVGAPSPNTVQGENAGEVVRSPLNGSP